MKALGRALWLVGLLGLSGAGGAEPAPPQVRQELEGLMNALQQGGCRLQRNGSWHVAAEARAHLQRKLAYLEDHGGVRSTEQFIEQGASKSSSSGQPYQVQCGGQPARPSRDWLMTELARQRQAQSR